MSADEDQAAEDKLRLIVALLSLGYSTWMIWMLIPQHQRQLWAMRVLAAAKTAARKFARRAGAGAMRAELATDRQNYALPYSLSCAADWLGRVYDKTRNVQ